MDPKHLALLRIHDACQGLSAAEIEAIAATAEVMRVNEGELIHSDGQKIDSLCIVIEGRLKMALKLPDGTRRTLRYISAGDQFGALMLVNDDEFPVEVTVDETAVLFRIQKEKARQLVDQFPTFRRNLVSKVGHSVHDSMLGARRKRLISKIVAFVHVDDRTKSLVADIASRLTLAGEKVGILSDSEVAAPPGTPINSLRNQAGDYIDTPEVRATLEQWPDLTRIFIVADRNFPAAKLKRLVELSDKVFAVSGTDNFDPLVDDLERFIQQSPSWQKKTHFVWLLGDDEQVAPRVPRLAALVQRDFKVQLSNERTDTRLSSQGIDRIIHYLRDISIGIALSGGAAHGMTHLGVLKALEEAGITIDRMAGTSAGVLTGVLYCAGYSPDWGINQFPHDLEPGSIYKKLPHGDALYMLKKYRTNSWDPMLRKYLHDWRLSQLPIPVNTVTTDLISARSVVRSGEDAVDSILESINLPVLATPICRDGMLLVDGGILNNLPADILVNQGCNFVLAIDVAANIDHRVGDNTSETPKEEMKPPGVVQALLRCLKVQANNMSAVGAAPADVTIAPDVSQFESTAFTKTPEMAEIGYQATVESLPRIREILHRLDGDLFGETAMESSA